MRFLDQEINPLGMGCWPIGGPMFSGDKPLGYSNAEDGESLRTIHAALDAGITLFDTAAAYGAGHSERLLAQALKARHDALVVTKIGIAIDEQTKQLSFDPIAADAVLTAIDGCLRRLERDRIDLMLLHQNDMPIAQADAVFDQMERAVDAGKIRAFGWSTDYSVRTRAMAPRAGFVAVEHAMNLFFEAPTIQQTVADCGVAALIRSPLAMGVLTGKYGAGHRLPAQDIRTVDQNWMEYYIDGSANPRYLAKLDAMRALLTTDGRSLVQGALCWLWGKRAENIPLPGARLVSQIQEIAGALDHGPLPAPVMAELDRLTQTYPQDFEERPR